MRVKSAVGLGVRKCVVAVRAGWTSRMRGLARIARHARRLDLVADDVTGEAPVKALVEEDPHEKEAISRSFACSRKAMTCFLPTDGKPSRKSSIDSPASR